MTMPKPVNVHAKYTRRVALILCSHPPCMPWIWFHWDNYETLAEARAHVAAAEKSQPDTWQFSIRTIGI